MPDIILKVVSVDAAQPAQAFARSFDVNGGTIGRDESNTLSLPDKHRRVSRLHATVSFPAGVPTITNSSTSLPIAVGEQQLDYGESMPIQHGTLIEVGPYVLQAYALSLDASPMPSPSAKGHSAMELDPGRTALPEAVAAARQHSGMTVVLPPIVAAPAISSVVPAVPAVAYRAPPLVQPTATALPDSLLGSADLSDLLGGIGGAPVVPSVQASPPSFAPPVQMQTPAPFYAPPPASVSPPQSSYIPPAPPNQDPFADLLAGIGGPASGSPPAAASSGYMAPAPSVVHTPSGLSADPLAAFGASPSFISGGAADPFGLGVAGGAGGSSARPASMGAGAIPDQFNPFDLPSSTGRNDADPLSSLLGGTAQAQKASAAQGSQVAPSIDSLFQSAPSGGSDSAMFGFSAQRPATDGTLDSLISSNTASDPLALFDTSIGAPADTSRAMRNDSLEVGSAFQPPLPVQPASVQAMAIPSAVSMPFNPLAAQNDAPFAAPRRPVAMATTAAAPSVPSASPDVLTDAFLRGAGLAPSALPHGLTPEIMTTIGSLLRSATAGAIDMLAARAATKREVQASVTIISVQANNPLKFLPNADSALLQLLGKKMPGFMRADVAMKDAFEDLRAHEVGVIAGTRAALTEVLGKFDPAVLGDKLTKGSVLESLMPSARKAKLWDMYLERYLQIRREAEDDFQSIFGRAFVQAYELETARIKGDTSGSGGE